MNVFNYSIPAAGRSLFSVDSGSFGVDLGDLYSSSQNQLDPSILLVCFPDPTMKHAIPYTILYIIPVLMVLYFYVIVQNLLYHCMLPVRAIQLHLEGSAQIGRTTYETIWNLREKKTRSEKKLRTYQNLLHRLGGERADEDRSMWQVARKVTRYLYCWPPFIHGGYLN